MSPALSMSSSGGGLSGPNLTGLLSKQFASTDLEINNLFTIAESRDLAQMRAGEAEERAKDAL